MAFRLGAKLVVAAVLLAGAAGCGGNVPFIAQATATATRTPRPTFTPMAQPTNTFVPLPTTAPTLAPLGPTTAPTKPKTATRTPTKKPPTPKPATAVPPTAVVPTVPPAPVASTMEYHVNPPRCEHSGMTYIKGTVYNDKNDPTNIYVGAIVALGPPNASTMYVDPVKTDARGHSTFVLSGNGASPGTWGVWMIKPDGTRKSDIGGPVTTNNLPADNPSSCWAGIVDFWK